MKKVEPVQPVPAPPLCVRCGKEKADTAHWSQFGYHHHDFEPGEPAAVAPPKYSITGFSGKEIAKTEGGVEPPLTPHGEAEMLAKLFHDTYERLAPQFGYETRKESAKPWAEVPENNRNLMTAVCAEVMSRHAAEIHILERQLEESKWQIDDLRKAAAKPEPATYAEIAESRQRSMTWGDLPEVVRTLCCSLQPPRQPHEWDNMNISEQRNWAVNQLGISERFLNVERSNHQVSINQWSRDVAAAERDTRERCAQLAREHKKMVGLDSCTCERIASSIEAQGERIRGKGERT